eukprot:1933056-Pleurochrysis_carterae.AAC.1
MLPFVCQPTAGTAHTQKMWRIEQGMPLHQWEYAWRKLAWRLDRPHAPAAARKVLAAAKEAQVENHHLASC